jgi:hypothetical protein
MNANFRERALARLFRFISVNSRNSRTFCFFESTLTTKPDKSKENGEIKVVRVKVRDVAEKRSGEVRG